MEVAGAVFPHPWPALDRWCRSAAMSMLWLSPTTDMPQTIAENVLCLVSWVTAPWVWTLRVLNKNLLTYLQKNATYTRLLRQAFSSKANIIITECAQKNDALTSTLSTFFDTQNKIIVIRAKQ